MDKNFELVDSMMNGIMQTAEWGRIAMNDPQIVQEQARLNTLMDKMSGIVPQNMLMALEETISQLTAASSDVAVLYGIHVALAIQKIAADPTSYSAARIEAAAKRWGH